MLGQLLVANRAISQDQLDQAVQEQRRSGALLGDVLVSLRFLSEESLARALSLISLSVKGGTNKYAAAMEAVTAAIAFRQSPSSPGPFASQLKGLCKSPLATLLVGYFHRWLLTDEDLERIIRAINAHAPTMPVTYYLQTKRPECLEPCLKQLSQHVVLVTTLETNRDSGYSAISKAPVPSERYRQFAALNYPRKVITIENNWADRVDEPIIDENNRRYSALAWMLRARFLVDIDCWTEVRGRPIKQGTIYKVIRARLAGGSEDAA